MGWDKPTFIKEIAVMAKTRIEDEVFIIFETRRRYPYGELLTRLAKTNNGLSEALVKHILDEMITNDLLKYYGGTIRVDPKAFRLGLPYQLRGAGGYLEEKSDEI